MAELKPCPFCGGVTMREILFRGKRLDNGEWVEGSLVVANDRINNGKHYILVTASDFSFGDGGSRIRIGCFAEVDPATVGQYTGLTDKNGKRIFEGDVIECWSEGVRARGTVQQNRGGLWIIYPAWQKRIMWGLCPNEDGSTDVEIISNIHDNPELVEGGEG